MFDSAPSRRFDSRHSPGEPSSKQPAPRPRAFPLYEDCENYLRGWDAWSFAHRIHSCRRWGTRRMTEQDAGFHLHGLSIDQVRPELPLQQRIGDDFCLVRERAEKMDVLHLTLFVDDDAHGNGVEAAFGEKRIHFLHDVFVARVVLDAHWDVTAARPGKKIGLGR